MTPFGFAHCPECNTVFAPLQSALFVHPCPARMDHVRRYDEIWMHPNDRKDLDLRRIRESAVTLPVLWCERVSVQP